MGSMLRYASHWIDCGAIGQHQATVGFDRDGAVRSAVIRLGGQLIEIVGELSSMEISILQEEQAGRDNDPNNRADFFYDEWRAA